MPETTRQDPTPCCTPTGETRANAHARAAALHRAAGETADAWAHELVQWQMLSNQIDDVRLESHHLEWTSRLLDAMGSAWEADVFRRAARVLAAERPVPPA